MSIVTIDHLPTPFYCIDEQALHANMQRIARLRKLSGAKVLLALKCFSTWSVFPLMHQYMDGTTSSSLYEVKLGAQKFGGETHAYSVAYADHEIDEVLTHCDKIIFNSLSQLQRFGVQAKAMGKPVGLRVNPGISNSPYLLADPARPYSRLGESDPQKLAAVIKDISGLMFHNNCENRSFSSFDAMLRQIETRFGYLIEQLQWISLGGGIHFSEPDYPLEQLADRLKIFAQKFQIQVYLEPGEAAIATAATLEVSVLDVGCNGKPFVIVDSSTEAHMLDLLVYDYSAKIVPNTGRHSYIIGGKTCLAGDIFGEFHFDHPLQVGTRISIQDAAGYTMVKKNWFNGINMPAIVVKRFDGTIEVIREFNFDDYVSSLS